MKNFRFLTLLFAMLSLFAVSCDNEPIDPTLNNGENPENPGNQLGTFSVDFNGRTFSTTSVTAVEAGISTSITAVGANAETFSLNIRNLAVGTFPTNQNVIVYIPDATDEENLYASVAEDLTEETGSITITSINTETGIVSGTFMATVFNFEGEQIQLANGRFSVPITQVELPEDESLTATIDGQEIVPIAVISSIFPNPFGDADRYTISGSDAFGRSIMLDIDTDILVQTYTITGDSDIDKFTLTVNGTTGGGTLTSGTLVITTKTDNRLAGTFSGIAEDDFEGTSYTITNGRFDVTFE